MHIAATHPCLEGHFPDKPIVPGALILELVAKMLLEQYSEHYICGFPYIKFLSPLAPETEFTISWQQANENNIDFTCNCGLQLLVKGRLKLQKL